LDRAVSIGARLSSAESGRFYWAPPETFYAYVGFCRWLVGYPDQALASARQAVSIARAGGRDYFIALAQGYFGLVHQLRGQPETGEVLKQSTVLADQQGFPVIARINGALHRIGIDQICTKLDGVSVIDFARHSRDDIPVPVVPYILESCARSLAKLGRHDDAQFVLEDAFAASRRGARWFDAELHRTRGELGLRRSPNAIE